MTVTAVENERAMLEFGSQISYNIAKGEVIFLAGELGAGKTTLVKGVLLGLGYNGNVTSPTYTLVESYAINDMMVFHLDLYRMKSPEELEMIGFRDMLSVQTICLIEWPERALNALPRPDKEIMISYADKGRTIEIVHR